MDLINERFKVWNRPFMFFSLDLPVTKNQHQISYNDFVVVSIQKEKSNEMKWQQKTLADIWCLVFVF